MDGVYTPDTFSYYRYRESHVPTKMGIVRESFKTVSKEYCAESSICGLKHLVDKDTPLIERLLWVMILIVGVCCSVTLVWMTFIKYYKAPLVTTQLPEGVSVSKIIFPAVGICTNNRISKRAVTALAKRLSEEERNKNYSEEEMMSLLFGLGQLYDVQPMHSNIVEPLKLHQVLGDYSVHDLMQNLTPTCEDLLIRCVWNTETKNCLEIFDFRLTVNGYCCTFNYLRLSDKSFKNEEADLRSMDMYSYGNKSTFDFDQGLKVMLRMNESDDFFYNIPLQGAQLQFSDAYDFPDAPSGSFAMQIINPEVQRTIRRTAQYHPYLVDIPPIRTHRFGSTFLMRTAKIWNTLPSSVFPEEYNPGLFKMTVMVSASFTEASRDIQHVPLNQRKCRFYDESSYLPFYTYSDCILKCRMFFLLENCNCTPFNMPKMDNARTCDMRDVACLRIFYAQSIAVRPNVDPIPPELELELVGGGIDCPMCCPTCSKTDYSYDFNNVNIYPEFLNGVPDDHRDEWVIGANFTGTSIVHVKYAREVADCYGRNVIMKWFDLISNIGSTCGFVTGFSFVSVLEFIYFFTVKFIREIYSRRNGNNNKKTKPHNSFEPISRYRPIYWNELTQSTQHANFHI